MTQSMLSIRTFLIAVVGCLPAVSGSVRAQQLPPLGDPAVAAAAGEQPGTQSVPASINQPRRRLRWEPSARVALRRCRRPPPVNTGNSTT